MTQQLEHLRELLRYVEPAEGFQWRAYYDPAYFGMFVELHGKLYPDDPVGFVVRSMIEEHTFPALLDQILKNMNRKVQAERERIESTWVEVEVEPEHDWYEWQLLLEGEEL